MTTAEQFKAVLRELQSLYEQDKCNDVEDKTPLTSEQLTLNHAYVLIDEIKIGQSNKLLETRSRKSRHSHRSRSLSSTSTTSSAARIKALAEAAAARENAEYERIIAEKEHARSEREAELERNRQQERAQHDRDLAMLAANRKVAVADAKLKAIELAIEEQEIEERGEIPGIPHAKTEERTLNWVHSNPNSVTQSLPQKFETKCQPEILKGKDEGREQNWVPSKLASEVPLIKNEVPQQNFPMSKFSEVPRVNTDRHTPSQPFVASTPIRETSASHLIETLTFSNKQLVAGLARQNLPKCHPDTFSGDPTIFHPWKMAFKARISDAEVSPVNEINYLRSFTSGEPQRLVDNYRKRQQLDPSALLKNLWEELERRFGSPAVITNTLLERMHETAAFSDNENLKLQEFADLCADIESQIAYLPGLAYLNFPNAIQPIVEKLPPSLRGKWKKEIANHYEKNAGAYPGFMVFSKVVQNQAKIKNNPNVHIGAKLTPVLTLTPSRGALNGRALNTNTRPADNGLQSPPEREETTVKRCPFHERTGHSLEECIAFRAKTFEEKNEWIWNNRLCFRCFSGDHQAHNCKQQIKCNTCGDNRHPTLLHKEKPRTNARSNETVNAQCTAVCSTSSGGTSCSKVLLVDVFLKDKSYLVRRVYAIIDEQSNSSLISSELLDELGVLGPQEKYYLSTCTSEKEIKYGRRVTGVSIQSPSGTGFQLPTLIECDSIPQDKHEIPTPEMARRFPHLQEIANEISPYDSNADVHLLIGRDAPELLKVREFRNGPKGAPWAQRLTLGWTITGQMCLDFAGGPVHALVRRTNLRSANEITSLEVHPCQQTESYELVPCPNRFKIMESLSEQEERLRENIFHTSREDNETSLSCEDRKFLEEFGKAASNFVHRNFYVDDGLASLPTAKQAIDLVTTAQAMLATANLRLHKVVSNSVEVMEIFPTEDRGKDIRDLDLRRDSLPAQRSLGVYWDLEEDAFTFRVALPDKPFTRRGVLSIVNSIYDPLGPAVPVLLEGRLLLQQLVIMGKKKNNDMPLGWDDPLPETQRLQWQRWQSSIGDLEKITVPRCYHTKDFGRITRTEIHAFSDASKDAIGASVYLRLISHKGEISTTLLFGQSRVAPAKSTSIPRLELCAATLVVQAGARILKEIDMKVDEVTYYTDSRVVLGYLQNDSRRFYVYVANRVQLIRRLSSPSQWRYIDTTQNPADLATRRLTASNLAGSDWLEGPCFLRSSNMPPPKQEEISLDAHDPEVRKEVLACAMLTKEHHGLGTKRFTRFSSLASLQRAIANLIVVVKEFRHRKAQRRLRSSPMKSRLWNPTVKELEQAIMVIMQAVQEEAFGEELKSQHYVQTLQKRSKWNSPRRNLNTGDVVLVKEDGAHRNDWPLGRITEAIKSEDGEVRKAQVELLREGRKTTFLRPIKEFVLLVPVQPDGTQPTVV